MKVYMDEDVKKVLEFMQSNLPAYKFVAVSKSINDLAMSLWGHYKRENITAIALKADPILVDGQHTQSIASE
jgi:hypothetical protein